MDNKDIILYNLEKKKLEKYEYSSKILFLIYEKKAQVPSIEDLSEYKSNGGKIRLKIQKRISIIEDFIPLYEPKSDGIYLIAKENVYYRVKFENYRLPNESLKNNFLENYHLETLEATYYKVFYHYANEVGKNITYCERPSFTSELPHVKPYFTRSELINLALNMNLIKPNKIYYDVKKIEELCPKVQENDISKKIILNHRDHINKNNAIYLMQYYTLNGSYVFNSYLRNEKHSNEILEQNINSVESIISSAPSFDKEYIVYRFLEKDDFLSDLKEGEIFTDKGFVSTTRDPFYHSEYYQFGFVLLKIHLPKNKIGVGLCVESYSHFPQEQEIILPPNTQLKLINRDLKFDFYHIDSDKESRIIKKYEFEVVFDETKKNTSFFKTYENKDKQKEAPLVLLDASLNPESSLKVRIIEFEQKYLNKFNQFTVQIGKNDYTMIVDRYDSTGAYKNFYASNNPNGFLIYSFYEGTILFMIEIVEPLQEMHVNYYFRYSENTLLYKLVDEKNFLLFISSLSALFGIQKVVMYSDYKFCDKKTTSNYCVDYYNYLKNKKKRFSEYPLIKSKFDYLQLDKLFSIDVATILTPKDRDEIYQIYFNIHPSSSILSVANFYTYIVENNCSLIRLFEKKIERLYTGLSKYLNPFLRDYYYIDPYSFLYSEKLIKTLPKIDDSSIEVISFTENIDMDTNISKNRSVKTNRIKNK